MPNDQLAIDRERARQAERDEMLDLRTISRAIGRNWLLIAIVSLVALAATAALYVSANPTYVATAQLMVERIPDEPLAPADRDVCSCSRGARMGFSSTV